MLAAFNDSQCSLMLDYAQIMRYFLIIVGPYIHSFGWWRNEIFLWLQWGGGGQKLIKIVILFNTIYTSETLMKLKFISIEYKLEIRILCTNASNLSLFISMLYSRMYMLGKYPGMVTETLS